MAESLVTTRHFKFDLVAPEKIMVSSMEERVMVPGELGDFMVLPGHTLLLAGLRPGVVSILHDFNNATHYFITGGLVDVGNHHCTVLTPHITPVASLYADKIANEIEQLEETLAEATEIHDIEHIEAELALLRIKFDIAKAYNG